MKGFTLIITGLVLALFLSACGEETAARDTGVVDLSNEGSNLLLFLFSSSIFLRKLLIY